MRHTPVRTSLSFSRFLGSLLLVAAAVCWGGLRDAGAQEPGPSQRWDGFFELVSGRHDVAPPTWTPPQPADAPSRMSRHAISRDGRYVVFDSDATNWGYSSTALYRRDRQTGQTQLLLAGPAVNASISGDGNHIAFEICEPFMRPDSQPVCDAWALDLRSWTWSLLSGTPAGSFGSADSGQPVLSVDGRFAVFVTRAQNLTGDTSPRRHVVLRDRDPDGNGIYDEPGTAVLETISAGLPTFGDADSETADVSDDGRFVAFRSLAANLVPGDTNATWDVFLRDRQAGDTRRLNLGPQGEQSLASIDEPHLSISADGRYVAFSSIDGQLAASAIDDVNGVHDVFVYDGQASALSRVDVGRAVDAPALGNAPSHWPTLSADGRYVVLESAATNVDVPPTGNIGQVYVVDRTTGQATRVSTARSGQDNGVASGRPSISGDGSVVLFWSTATTFASIDPPVAEQLYAAVHLAIEPANVTVPARGGDAAFTVTTQPHTLWWAVWDPTAAPWVLPSPAPQGVGSGTMQFTVGSANPDGAPRTATITIGDATATVTQAAGLSLIAVTPASGPTAGGTLVTLTGTGFEPGMIVYFGGAPAGVEYVDTTTLRVTTPPSDNGTPHAVPVAVGIVDGRYAWLDWAFEYTPSPDSTPPMVIGWASGPQGQNGWFIGDVTITWGIHDPDSPVSTPPCPPVIVTQDTSGTTHSCTATSAGGTTTASVFVKRDTTPPVVTVTSPRARQFVDLGAILTLDFTCADTTSAVAICGMAAPTGAALDTATPGWKSVAAAAFDAAGNLGTASVEYVVSTGTCQAPMPGMQYWQRFQNDLRNSVGTTQYGGLSNMNYSWTQGVVGQAFYFPSRYYGFMDQYHAGRLDFAGAMTAALWIRPESTGLATLLDNAQQYRLDREADGTIRWTLYGPNRAVAATGVSATRTPLHAWSHVTFTYAAGEVKLFIDGRPDSVWTVALTTLNAVVHASDDHLIIGALGPFSATNYYVGAIDDIEMFDRALEPAEIEALFLTLASGTCPPKATRLEIPDITLRYDAGTLPIRVTLLTVDGEPVAGRTVRITNGVVNPQDPFMFLTAVTDETGTVRWDAPLNARPAIYAQGISAYSFPDVQYHAAPYTTARVVVEAIPTQVTWTTPAPVTYGTALGAAQLNATADVAGTFGYTPGFNTVLGAGARVLTVSFTPSSVGYATATATVTLEVRKAVPVMSVTGGSFTYDGQPHAALATVRDYRGIALTPVTVTYDGAPAIPVAPGTYAVSASYAGDANHEPRTVTTTLTIAKATPTISFSSGTFTYDGTPHGLTATVTGIGGAGLGTVPVMYDGSPAVPVDAGTYVVSATFAGNTLYEARTSTATLTIAKATPAISLAPLPATFTYDGQPHGLTATVTGAGGASLGTVPVTYDGGAPAPVDAGTYTASATFGGDANHTSRTVTTTVTITKAIPAIAFSPLPATFVYDGQPHELAATLTGVDGAALGPVPVTYDGSPTLPVGAGAYTASATFAGNANYTTRTASATLTIAKAVPVVTIGGGPVEYTAQPRTATVTVTGVAGQTPPGAVTVNYNGSTMVPINAGTYAVVATIAPSANYEAASGSGTFVIAPSTSAVTWPAPAAITFGTALSGIQLDASTGRAGTYTYTPAAGAVLDAGPGQTLTVTFTPDSTNHAPATATTTIDVRKATPTVGAAFSNVFYDGQPHAASASARGVNWELLEPVAVTYNGSSGVPVNAGVYEIVTSYPGSANYEAASSTITREIYKASVSHMTWLGPGTLVYGTPLGPAQFDTSANVPGTFAFSPGPGAILDVGTHTITATFTATDPNYNVATLTNTVGIVAATPAITVTAGAFTYDGQPHAASASVTGIGGAPLGPATLTYNGSASVPVATGTYTVVASYAGGGNYGPVSRTATLTIGKAAAVLSWNAPPAVGYGTPLGAGQLNATASVPGTFAYTPSLGAVLGAGSNRPLSATFTPADPANYTGGTVSTTLPVVPAPLTVRTNDAAKAYGAPLPGFTAAFSGLVNGDTPASLGGALVFATAATPSSPVGAYTVTPSGVMSANYAIAFAAGTLSIIRSPVTVTLTSSPTPSGLDMPITFTATVAAAQAAPTAPAGTVRFFDGATLLGTATLAGGSATLLTGGLTAGTHTVEARYDGDASFDTGTRTASHGVNTAAATPAITIASSRQPASTSQSMTFTATITVATSGTIAFYDGNALLGSGSIASGRATLTVSALAAGSHAITARFQGNASAPPVISPVFVQSITSGGWKDRTSTLTLASSANPSALGTTATFTATASGSSGTPTGRILFMVDGLIVGDPTGVAMTNGQAAASISTLNGGRHKVTATYLGNSNYRGSTGALTQTVN